MVFRAVSCFTSTASIIEFCHVVPYLADAEARASKVTAEAAEHQHHIGWGLG